MTMPATVEKFRSGWRSSCRYTSGRRGFSFAEVMFAVIILGVGFIMIAGIFPVAIQQNQTTNEESTAAAAAREAANTIASLPQTLPNLAPNADGATPQPLLLFPPTVKQHYKLPSPAVAGVVAPPAVVAPFCGARWQAIQNNLISMSDPRYAYVPFYKRESGSNVAQLIVLSVAIRNRPIYDPSKDVQFAKSTNFPTLNYQVTPAFNNAAANIAGAYMTVIPSTITTSSACIEGASVTFAGGAADGAMRTYRLGRQINAAATLFEIDPGDDLTQASGADGVWGTGDDVTDAYVANQAGVYYPPATLQPIPCYASVFSAPGSLGGRIMLSNAIPNEASLSNSTPPPSAAPGSFVIVADDYPYDSSLQANTQYILPLNNPNPGAGHTPWTVGALNGRIFRLGQAVPVSTATPTVYPGTYEVDPAYAMRPGMNGAASPDQIPSPYLSDAVEPHVPPDNHISTPWARCYIIGAGRTDPTVAGLNSGYSGAAQDVSIYTTFIAVQ